MEETNENTQSDSKATSGRMQRLVRLFIVLYDDESGLQCPMAWDDECEGAISAWWHPKVIASFESRKEARAAINISTKYAQLRKAQGEPENTDFTEFKKHLRVVELYLPNVKLNHHTPKQSL